MADDDANAKTRADRLRERIAQRNEPSANNENRDDAAESQPRPGESPNAFVERRMRETLKKKP